MQNNEFRAQSDFRAQMEDGLRSGLEYLHQGPDRVAQGWTQRLASTTAASGLFAFSAKSASRALWLGDDRGRMLVKLAVAWGKVALREALLEPGQTMEVELSGARGVLAKPERSTMLWSTHWLDLVWLSVITGDQEAMALAAGVALDDLKVSDNMHQRPWISGLQALLADDRAEAVRWCDDAVEQTSEIWLAGIDGDDHREYVRSVERGLILLTRAVAQGDRESLESALMSVSQGLSQFLAQYPAWAVRDEGRPWGPAAAVCWARRSGLEVSVPSPFIVPELLEPGWEDIPVPVIGRDL